MLRKDGPATDSTVALDRALARRVIVMAGILFRPENGPVRILTERIGEVANLSNPYDNRRSIAALLAKKYFERHQRLRNIFNAGQGRELTEREVNEVFELWGRIRAGEFAQPDRDERGAPQDAVDPPECADTLPGDAAPCPPEPDEEDSCL
jgi:hypothetical protein